LTIFGTGATFSAMTTPNKRDTLRYLSALRKAGCTDLAIAQSLGLRCLDTLRKWRDTDSVPLPKRFGMLKAMAEKARAEK